MRILTCQRLAAALLLCLFYINVSFAQIKSGTITGTVMDRSGGVIPGAKVVILNEDTGIKTEVASNDSGEYSALYLPAGRYTVQVAHEGFTPFSGQGIEVNTAQTVRADVKLAAQSVSSTVDVVASTVTLQTESSDVSNSVGQEIIQALPNANNNPLYYATLQPGVVARSAFEDTQSVEAMGIGIDARRALSAISINGGPAFANDITVDGVSVQGSAWNEATVLPNRDGIQEVRTSINNFTAEYGRGQGVIAMTTKSGGNQFHGTTFYQNRNEAFNANSFGNNANRISRPAFKAHQYGATFGGPIWIPKVFNGRNKAFFFISYEGLYHNRGLQYLQTVPTAKERVGDFSETYVTVGNVPKPLMIFDPFTATPVAGSTNGFRHDPIPNARLDQYRRADGTTGVDPYMAKLISAYPLPNRTPDSGGNCAAAGLPNGCLNQNNFLNTVSQQFRKNNFNGRLDFKANKHSPYLTFGIAKGHINTPRTWGEDNQYYNQPSFIGNNNQDNNPYGAIGDTWVLSPTVVLDIRYGLNRINTQNTADTFDNFDYLSVGIPASLLALNGAPGAPPDFPGGSGTLGKYSSLNNTSSTHKQEHQTNHVLAASVTKVFGRLTSKVGGEGRVYLSNYIDPEESFWIKTDQLYTREQVTNTGAAFGTTPDANAAGYQLASALLGGGTISVAEGRSVQLALAQKYLAVFSQNDWRATNSLTLNLGVRWDYQPGPTERYNQISSVDLTQKNPYGTQGVIAFPGTQDRSRNLWKSRYKDFAPRSGFAYRLNNSTVLRGGYGLTYLPSNTGFYDGTYNYGAATFSTFTDSVPYGDRPAGQLVGRYYEVNRILTPAGANPAAAANYGAGTPRFDYNNWRSGTVQQWNFFVQRSVGRDWTAAVGYVGTKGDHLAYDGVPINSAQYISPDILNSWRNAYIASNGTNPANNQIPNPFQPNPNALIPFKGNIGRATLSQLEALYPNPHFGTVTTKQSNGFSRYNALQTQLNRRFASGISVNANYTWSKSQDMSSTAAQNNQGYNETGGNSNLNNLLDYRQNKKLSVTDVPHRFVASFVIESPFGQGRRFQAGKIGNTLLGNWRIGGTALMQSGYPLQIDGLDTGSLNARPDRVPGVPAEVPAALQHWYDGNTTVTLPSGRTYTPPARTYLKYNPEAFTGRVVTTANGSIRTDLYWYGNAALTYNDIRSDFRKNLNASLTRNFKVNEKLRAEFQVNASNVLNHTQFRPNSYTRGLGTTSTTVSSSQGIGTTTSNTFGSHGTGTFESRHIELQLKLRF